MYMETDGDTLRAVLVLRGAALVAALVALVDPERVYRALRQAMEDEHSRLYYTARSLVMQVARAGAYSGARGASRAEALAWEHELHAEEGAVYRRAVQVKYCLAILTGRYDGRMPVTGEGGADAGEREEICAAAAARLAVRPAAVAS